MRRPSLNRTRRGWPTYNPFLGSSTKLAAAELTVRLRLAVDRAADGFENLHSTPAPRNGLRSAKFRSAASSHSRNAV